MCKINGCKENHSDHYCYMCGLNSADHLEKNCPEGTSLRKKCLNCKTETWHESYKFSPNSSTDNFECIKCGKSH